VLAPASAFAEAIDQTTFAVLRQAPKEDRRIIGVTSVLRREGASTIAAALGQSLTKTGRSVILIDCDLRHPELTQAFAPHARMGWQEVLLGEAELSDVILRDGGTGLAFLPGSVGRRAVRPEQLLASAALKIMLTQLRQRYDYVLVDLPPMLPMLDLSLTERLLEAFVIVVAWGARRADTLSHALARCPVVRERLLGLVLNKVDAQRLSVRGPDGRWFYAATPHLPYLLHGPASDASETVDPSR
jgi:succinoglycan biosynthesis transport protein ExoP